MISVENCRPWMTMYIFLVMMMVILVSGNISNNKNAKIRDTNSTDEDPKPREWPQRLHAMLVMYDPVQNVRQVNNLWYDWQNGLNVQLIQYQLDKLVHAVSWNNGTSFYFTLNDDYHRECIIHELGVGILKPNWLEGAEYLGQREVDGHLCNVWEKLEFVWYYEDVFTKMPVYWIFYNGIDSHVMTFEEWETMLDKSQWQTPAYCFDKQVQTFTDSYLAIGLRQGIYRGSDLHLLST